MPILQLARTVERIKNMKSDDKYLWTKHSQYKMKRYGLSPQRIKRIIRHPARTEEAIVPEMIASMQPAGGKHYSEIWTIYKFSQKSKNINIITAWRYPGKSPARNPIPQEILEEIKSII